jgi:hypothetical protein
MSKMRELIDDLSDTNLADASVARKEAVLNSIIISCSVLDIDKGNLVYTGDDKNALSQNLLRSMPLYDDNEIKSFSDPQLDKMRNSRMFWEGKFPLVNVSRMKRLALVYMELSDVKNLNKQAAKWVNKHGGIPSKATKFGDVDSTVTIVKDDIKALMENKDLWKRHRAVFSKRFGTDDTDNANVVVYSETQNKFVTRMNTDGLSMNRILDKYNQATFNKNNITGKS